VGQEDAPDLLHDPEGERVADPDPDWRRDNVGSSFRVGVRDLDIRQQMLGHERGTRLESEADKTEDTSRPVPAKANA
jgi:hypothetical protein